MIEHTPGPWDVKLPYVYRDNDHGSCRVHWTLSSNLWGDDGNYTPREENGGNAHLVGHAYTAPHECADPQCPGNVHRRKLAAFDGLLAVAEYAQSAAVALSEITDRIIQEAGQPALSTERYAGIENIRLVARGLERRAAAAIAAAKAPTSPDAPGTGDNDGVHA